MAHNPTYSRTSQSVFKKVRDLEQSNFSLQEVVDNQKSELLRAQHRINEHHSRSSLLEEEIGKIMNAKEALNSLVMYRPPAKDMLPSSTIPA